VTDPVTNLVATPHRFRIRFTKQGDLRFLSHHDLMRLWERMLRRAQVPIARTQGFNPRPRIIFAQALGLGIASQDEAVDLELTEPLPPAHLLERLRAEAPQGMTLLQLIPLNGRKSPHPVSAHFAFQIPQSRLPAAHAAAARFLLAPSCPYNRLREDRTISLDLRPLVASLHIDPSGMLHFSLILGTERSARPEEILDVLGLRDLLDQGQVLVRTRLLLAPESEPVPDPQPEPQPQPQPQTLPELEPEPESRLQPHSLTRSISHTESPPVTAEPLAGPLPDASSNSWASQPRENAPSLTKELA
jgi:radical SAM-linked protein